MNQVMEQVLRCSLDQEKKLKEWDKILSTIEMDVNSSVNKSTSYSLFFLMHGHHPVMPLELLRDREESTVEPINEFLTCMNNTWQIAKENMNKA